MSPLLDRIAKLAADVCARRDELDSRPAWLREMPGATHPGEPYYLFLFLLLAQESELNQCLEIGTRGGTSALHMAEGIRRGGRAGRVATVDVEPGCKTLVEKTANLHGSPCVEAYTGDSTDPWFQIVGKFDLLFIDGDHSYAASRSDYLRFRKQLRPSGLILFDDTRLNDGLKQAWSEIEDEKLELPDLHYMGFGAAIRG